MAVKAIIATVFLAMALAMPASAEPDNVAYNIETTTRTDSEDRSTFVDLRKWGNSGASYHHLERIDGATTPTVTARSFINQAESEPPGRFAALKQALIAAKACGLKSDADDWESPYQGSLRLRIGGTACDLNFSSPPTEPHRARVHKLLMDYAADLKIDRPDATDGIIRTSQGDREAPATVTIGDVLGRPEAYDGKRVAITGYVWLEFEGSQLCAKARAGHDDGFDRDKGLYPHCLWYGEPSSFAVPGEAIARDRSWARVEGVFFKGPAGHFGLWPGEITRLTKTEAAQEPRLEAQ